MSLSHGCVMCVKRIIVAVLVATYAGPGATVKPSVQPLSNTRAALQSWSVLGPFAIGKNELDGQPLYDQSGDAQDGPRR